MKQSKSFSDYKCLLYRENLQGIIDKKLLPPVEVNIDPINKCDLKCIYCNGHKAMNGISISKNDMYKLLDNLADWGVKAICWAGSGDAILHPDLSDFTIHCTKLGLESALITNGHSLSDKLIETIIDHMRWVGISVDAATKKTFTKLKRVDGFVRTIKNIYKLVYYKEMDKSRNTGITFKFLIHPYNQHEILDAVKLAKDLRCNSFHLRPVDFYAYKKKPEKLDLNLIRKQMDECEKLSDDNFEFIPFFINYDDQLNPLRYHKCLLSPLLGICLPDGWWVCIDRKGQKGMKLCGLHEIREFWGSEKHFEIIDKINPVFDCGKCSLIKYNPWFEAYRNDNFFWKFV